MQQFQPHFGKQSVSSCKKGESFKSYIGLNMLSDSLSVSSRDVFVKTGSEKDNW